MRSGPATRTAFASVNPASAFSRASPPICSSLCSASAPPVQLRETCPRTRRVTHRSCSAVAVPLGGTVSEEAATPGLPATLARFGEPLQQLTRTAHLTEPSGSTGSWYLSFAAEPPLTITGSATFTLAVSELSRISFRTATGINAGAVRNLWTLRLPCGKGRKSGRKLELVRIGVVCALETSNS